jgi:hypothetical protein
LTPALYYASRNRFVPKNNSLIFIGHRLLHKS